MRYALDEEETIVGKTMELYLGQRAESRRRRTTTTVLFLAAKTNEKTRTISTRIAGGEVMAVMPLVGMATEDAARKCRDVIAREVEKTGAFQRRSKRVPRERVWTDVLAETEKQRSER